MTSEQIKHYFREGYVVVPGLVPDAAIDDVLTHAGVTDEDLEAGTWHPVIFDFADPTQHAHVHRLLIEPSIIAAIEQVFEVPARVYFGMLAIVPAGGGTGLPWHQDNQYDQVIGAALNVFIALCDITPDKAILWVAPGSHLLGTQPSKESETALGHREAVVEPDNGIPLPAMKKGDVCIFDRSTYHRSFTNETNEHRYAYAAQYQADHARLAATGEKDPRKLRAAELAHNLEPVLGIAAPKG